jgi:hypothetical protein
MRNAYMVLVFLFLLVVVVVSIVLWSGLTVKFGGANYSSEINSNKNVIDSALFDYARTLDKNTMGVHPLDQDTYGPLIDKKGGVPGRSPAPAPKKQWTEYETWEEMQKNEHAESEYFKQRAYVLNKPNLDWGDILKTIEPKIHENREYIGHINLDEKSGKLVLGDYEASPVKVGVHRAKTVAAYVPMSLVTKYAQKPALFIFHTHSDDPRSDGFPSSYDLSAAIYYAASSRFAANVVISKHGVFVYGLTWDGYKVVNHAKDWDLAVKNLSHDVVVSHDAMRSWAPYTYRDLQEFYARHRLLRYVFPSPELVGLSYKKYTHDIEAPVDYELIRTHTKDIEDHHRKKMTRGSDYRY